MKVSPQVRNSFYHLQDEVLRKRREPGCNPIYDLLLKSEMMKHARFCDLIDLPAPFDVDDDALVRYADTFADRVQDAYSRFLVNLAEQGSDEEAAFQDILNYAKTRHLGGIQQSMSVDIPIPLPETRVGQSEKKGKGKGKGKVKGPRVSEEFNEDEDEFLV